MKPPPAPDVAQRWRALRLPYKMIVIVIGATIAFELAASLASGILGTPGGGVTGSSSSFTTSPQGTAAFVQLLTGRGVPVARQSKPLDQGRLTSNDTLFVLDPVGFSSPDAAAVVRFAEAGGRLVYAGQPSESLLAGLFPRGSAPVWSPDSAGPAARVVAQTVFTVGVSNIEVGTAGSYRVPAAEAQTLVAGPGGTFALTAKVGAGAVVLLASSAPLQNAGLALADNAGFALNLAGAGRRAVFDEFHHGLGVSGTGVAGLPDHWRVALVLLLASVVIWLVSAARRLGPPQAAKRTVIPPRIAHVDAVASLLAAGSDKRVLAGAESLRDVANRRLRARLRLGMDATAAEVRAAAAEASIPPGVLDPILDRPMREDQLLELGRAVAALAGGREGRSSGQIGRYR